MKPELVPCIIILKSEAPRFPSCQSMVQVGMTWSRSTKLSCTRTYKSTVFRFFPVFFFFLFPACATDISIYSQQQLQLWQPTQKKAALQSATYKLSLACWVMCWAGRSTVQYDHVVLSVQLKACACTHRPKCAPCTIPTVLHLHAAFGPSRSTATLTECWLKSFKMVLDLKSQDVLGSYTRPSATSSAALRSIFSPPTHGINSHLVTLSVHWST